MVAARARNWSAAPLPAGASFYLAPLAPPQVPAGGPLPPRAARPRPCPRPVLHRLLLLPLWLVWDQEGGLNSGQKTGFYICFFGKLTKNLFRIIELYKKLLYRNFFQMEGQTDFL